MIKITGMIRFFLMQFVNIADGDRRIALQTFDL